VAHFFSKLSNEVIQSGVFATVENIDDLAGGLPNRRRLLCVSNNTVD